MRKLLCYRVGGLLGLFFTASKIIPNTKAAIKEITNQNQLKVTKPSLKWNTILGILLMPKISTQIVENAKKCCNYNKMRIFVSNEEKKRL